MGFWGEREALLQKGSLSPPKTFDFIESLFAAFPVYPVGSFEKSVLFGTGPFRRLDRRGESA